MASLYIKDEEANRLAERLAASRGLTKTAAVKLALHRELERDRGNHESALSPAQADVRSVLERFWATTRLGEPIGPEADKAFFDSLSDQEDD